MERINFTKKIIEGFPASQKASKTYHHDARVRTLAVAVTPKGRKSFVWYKKVNGYPSRLNIGTFPEWTVEQARGQACEWNAQAAHGVDPAKECRARRLEGTLGAVFEEYAALIEKPEQQDDTRRRFARHLAQWQNRKLSAITHGELERLWHRIGREHIYEANQVLGLVRHLFNRALDDGWAGANPARGLKKFKERKRKRYLTKEELPRFFAACHDTPNRDLADYVLLLLFTGQRESLVRRMRWDAVTFSPDGSAWQVPAQKGEDPQALPLTPEAVEILARRGALAAPDGVYVFPGRRDGEPVTTFKTGWAKLLAAANILDLRRHDLRRTQATWQGSAGVALQITSKTLGHTTLMMTGDHYAMADQAAKRDALARTNRLLVAAASVGDPDAKENG